MFNNWFRVELANRLAVVCLMALGSVSILASASTASAVTPALAAAAEKAQSLVMDQNLAGLAKFNHRLGTEPQNRQLHQWLSTYLKHMKAMTVANANTYQQQSALAKKDMTKSNPIPAFEHLLAAYAVSIDKAAFKKKPWVISLVDRTAKKAASYNRTNHFLDALEIYTQLNRMYKISMRFYTRLQKVTRRTTLLAEYTPRQFYKLQESFLLKKVPVALPQGAHIPGQKSKPQAPTPKTPPSYHNWHKSIRGIHQDLLVEALDETEHHWVFNLNYNQLLTGGLKMIRLFPQTPMLADAFPRLKNQTDARRFVAAMKRLLKTTESHQTIDTDQMISIWSKLLSADKSSVKIPTGVMVKEFTNGALGTLDPFTDVFWPSQVAEFNKMMEGKFGGVGIQIQPHDGFLRVVSPLNGTPASRAGIEANDLITTVNGKSILGLSLDSVIHKIEGPPGTWVTLGIRRGKDPSLLIFHLKRAEIQVHTVEGFLRNPATGRWRLMIDPKEKIGYIRVTQFESNTAREFKRDIKYLLRHHVRGIIIDLRYNPGGLLEIALRMCRMFLKNGVILSTYGRTSPKQTWYATAHPMVPTNIPMIVLVNQDSASASEIFSGSMHDRHRALIIGHRTYGKGSVQNIIPIGLKQNAILKLTMAHYYLPDGECVERNPHSTTWGVEPNIVVPFSPAQLLALQETWMHAEILPTSSDKAKAEKLGSNPRRQPIKQEEFDTQLDTALMMMRLTLLQQASGS